MILGTFKVINLCFFWEGGGREGHRPFVNRGIALLEQFNDLE